MKTFKKFASALLAVVLVLGMSMTVFAAGPYTITINNEKTGHTYEAYQIFTGTLSDTTLSSIAWGSGVTTAGQTALGADAQTVADGLDDEADAKDFADALVAGDGATSYLQNPVTVNTSTAGKYTITGLDAGYYLIMDQDGSITSTEDDSYTAYIMRVVDDVEVSPKGSSPTVQKKVKDINDSEDSDISDNEWKDSADFDEGDDVPFQITGTLPDEYDEYEEYYYEFKDTLPEDKFGDAENVVVYVEDEDGNKYPLTEGTDYTFTQTGDDITIVFDDLKTTTQKDHITEDSKIVVEYTATLEETATVGSDGNSSEVYLVYSNDPNEGGEDSRGQTATDKVKVFTYKVVINKVEEDGTTPLAGAGFSLYKLNSAGTYDLVETIPADGVTTEFTFSHLDDGQYKLVESEVPATYNKLADQIFTVSATHTEGDDPQLTALTGNATSGSIAFTSDVPNAALSSTVINKPGANLPETGGIGTTIFYIVGGILVIGAGVLLVTKKRMENK